MPPESLCICALVTTAYPHFTDEQVTSICQDNWREIKRVMSNT